MTKEELNAIRARWARLGAHGIGEAQNDIDALIAALEQAQAERDEWIKAHAELTKSTRLIETVAALEQVTAERDVLAESDEFPCVRGLECPHHIAADQWVRECCTLDGTTKARGRWIKGSHRECWIEWAQREVAKRKEKAS